MPTIRDNTPVSNGDARNIPEITLKMYHELVFPNALSRIFHVTMSHLATTVEVEGGRGR